MIHKLCKISGCKLSGQHFNLGALFTDYLHWSFMYIKNNKSIYIHICILLYCDIAVDIGVNYQYTEKIIKVIYTVSCYGNWCVFSKEYFFNKKKKIIWKHVVDLHSLPPNILFHKNPVGPPVSPDFHMIACPVAIKPQ